MYPCMIFKIKKSKQWKWKGTKTCGTCVHMYAAKVSGMVDDDDGWSLVVEVVVVVVVVVCGLPSASLPFVSFWVVLLDCIDSI